MANVYLVAGKDEIDRRRRRLGPSTFVEVWQDLSDSPSGGLFWMGESAKGALDSVGDPLEYLLRVEEAAVSVYYGPHLAEIESLPAEESLKARVLSAHGIAVACLTYDRFGRRRTYEPTAPTDPTFLLRRPRGRTAHVWRLFQTRSEAVAYMTEHDGTDLEAVAWAEALAVEDFPALLGRFGRQSDRPA